MKFYFLIFILFLQISLFYSFLNTDDFCQKESINMKKCMAYDCETQFCTLNKQKCKSFMAWRALMKKYARNQQFMQLLLITSSHVVKQNTEIAFWVKQEFKFTYNN